MEKYPNRIEGENKYVDFDEDSGHCYAQFETEIDALDSISSEDKGEIMNPRKALYYIVANPGTYHEAYWTGNRFSSLLREGKKYTFDQSYNVMLNLDLAPSTFVLAEYAQKLERNL